MLLSLSLGSHALNHVPKAEADCEKCLVPIGAQLSEKSLESLPGAYRWKPWVPEERVRDRSCTLAPLGMLSLVGAP